MTKYLALILVYSSSAFAVLDSHGTEEIYNLCTKSPHQNKLHSPQQVELICRCVAKNYRYLLTHTSMDDIHLSWAGKLTEEQRKSERFELLSNMDYEVYGSCAKDSDYLSEKAKRIREELNGQN